jgi:hypothetical protein
MRQVKATDAHGNSAPRARSAGASAEDCSKYCGGAPTPPNLLLLPCPPPVGDTVARAHDCTREAPQGGTAVATLHPSTDRSLAMPSVAYLPFLACPPHGHNTHPLTHSPTRSLNASHTKRFDSQDRLCNMLQHRVLCCNKTMLRNIANAVAGRAVRLGRGWLRAERVGAFAHTAARRVRPARGKASGPHRSACGTVAHSVPFRKSATNAKAQSAAACAARLCTPGPLFLSVHGSAPPLRRRSAAAPPPVWRYVRLMFAAPAQRCVRFAAQHMRHAFPRHNTVHNTVHNAVQHALQPVCCRRSRGSRRSPRFARLHTRNCLPLRCPTAAASRPSST